MNSAVTILDYDRRPLDVKNSRNVVKNPISSSVSQIISSEEQLDSSSIPEFSQLKISTETIIAVSNLTFDLNNLYNYLPIVDYTVVKRKRGRKKKTEFIDPNKDIPAGSIISVQNKTNVRGAVLKKKKESKTYFLNSITVIVMLDEGKMINTKISRTGKWQITGCKTDNHFIDCVRYIYDNIRKAESYIGEKICTLKESKNSQGEPEPLKSRDASSLCEPELLKQETYPRMIFNVVMKNIDSKVGFSIQRDQLDTFMNMNTDFTSHYEGSINTGVNIKIKNEHPYEEKLTQIMIDDNGNPIISTVPYKEYLDFLDEKERKKEAKKEKFHTFLVFCSGSIIMSGSGPDMGKVYKQFMRIILKNRSEFEEKLLVEE